MNGDENGLPFEQFVQAITSQLDRAQRAMAIKAKNGNLPLTFAVKDLSLDLRTHVEMRGSAVFIRPAGPNETETSTIHLNLTTITRPMIEENAVSLDDDPGEPSFDDVLGDDVRDDEREELRRRLEWAGVHRVSQLRQLQSEGQEGVLQRVTQLPLSRLRTALTRVAVPRLTSVIREPQPPIPTPPGPREPVRGEPVPGETGQPPIRIAPSPPRIRLRGDNLIRSSITPVVRLEGQPIPILRATPREIVVAPPTHALTGTIALEVEPGVVLEADLSQAETVMSDESSSPSITDEGGVT